MEYVWLALGGVALCAMLHYGISLVAFLSLLLHEVGHWLMARILGVPAPIFSVGPEDAPYRVLGRAFGTELRWSKQWLRGAYVGIESSLLHPPWQRVLIAAGGLVANILAGIGGALLFWHLWPSWDELGIVRVLGMFLLFLFGFFNSLIGIATLVDFSAGSDAAKIQQAYRTWRAG